MIWEEEEGTLKLGFSTNLLDGYKPNIYFHQIEESPLKPSKQPALYESDIQVRNPDIKAKWSGLTITLHATTEELVTAITKVRIRSELFEDHKSEGGGIAIWPTGALVLEGISKEARKQALSKMSEQIGLDLTKDDQSYAVVRMVRILGDSLHPYCETGEYRNIERDDCLTPEALQAIRKLQRSHRQEPYVNLEGARGYIQFYNTFGTHFISSVEVGESIFQVFSYGKEAFRYLNKVYEENPLLLNEPFSTSFSQYTVARHAPYGYTSGISKICITSQDNKLSESIEAGKWYDSKYALTNSIFTPRLKPGTIDFNKMFRKNTAIEVKLTSINVFAEYYRKLIWRRVLKGALYCLYWKSPNVEPFFSNECPYDLNEIYKDSDIVGGDGLVSNIATPTVSFCKEIIDLGSIHVNFANLINVWSEFSNALQIPQSIPEDRRVTIELPGSSLVTIVSYIISVPNGGKYTVHLSLSEPAFKEMKSNFVCGEFYGGLLVTNPNATKSFVVMNGLLYEIVEGRVEIVSDIRTSPPSRILVEHLTDLQFSLISAEARLGYLFSKNALSPVEDQSLNVMRNFLLWLGREVSTTVEEDGSIAALKARALYLAKLANGNQGPGLPIPYLKYDAYRDTINSVQNLLTTVTANIRDFQNQIRARKEEERRLESEKTINENIIKSGQLIEGYIRAQEEYQRSLSQLYTTEYNEKKELCGKLKEKAGNSQYMLDKQRIEVNVQVVEYKEAVKRWQEEQTIRACLDIAANIFSLGFTYKAPSSSIKALESLGTKTQKAQKALNVFNALIKTYDAFDKFPSSPQHVVDALSQDLSNMEMTSLEWDEMKVEMDACLNTGPPVSEKISLSAAFAILVLRGKALLQVQNQLQTQLSELSALSSRTRISEEQVKRLEKLHLKLQAKPEELDVEVIDLVGLTGQLYLFQRQMLMTMASTIVIQDRALQYEYLRPPTPIYSFSMINLQLAILTQAQSINIGIQVQPSPELQETPIIYEIHGVKPSDLTDHNSYEFVIPLSAREFSAYNYVRVRILEWDVGGIGSKVNGKYYSELNFGGRPFFDRGFNGNALEFQTVPRMYTRLNNVENKLEILDPNSEGPIHRSGAMLYGKEKRIPIDRGRRHLGVENVTGTEKIEDIEATQIVSYSSHYYDESKEHDPELNPLESIVIDSIPYKEDAFKGMISDITPFSTWKISLPPVKDNEGLQFDNSLTIRLKFYIYAQLLERAITPLERIQRAISLRYGGSSATFMSDSQSDYSIPNVKPGDVSIPDILKMMSDMSVCAGTDVVFSLDEAQINKNFRLQYQNRKDKPEFFRSTGLVEGPIETTDTGVKLQTIFDFNFAAPRLQFYLNNSSTAKVKFFIESGKYTYKMCVDEKWVDVSDFNITKEDKYYVKGDVPLGTFDGKITLQQQVVVYLNKGAFSAQSFISYTQNPLMDQVLTNYFTNLKGGTAFYMLGTLDFKDYSLLESLTPTSFTFRVFVTNTDRKMLQLFITTTGSPQVTPDLYLKEPIPSLFQCSLIINTRILFSDILPATLKSAEYKLKVVPVPPIEDVNDDKPWSSIVARGEIPVLFEPQCVESYSIPAFLHDVDYETYIAVPNDEFVFDLKNMKLFHGDKNSSMNMIIDFNRKDAEYKFKYGKRTSTNQKPWTKIKYKNYSIQISMEFKTNLEFKVIGTGPNQLLQLSSSRPLGVKLTADIDQKSCAGSQERIREEFFKAFNKDIFPKFENLFDRTFPSISLFALKNILFPDDNLIEMKQAYVPGDLVVFGNFTK